MGHVARTCLMGASTPTPGVWEGLEGSGVYLVYWCCWAGGSGEPLLKGVLFSCLGLMEAPQS